MLPSIESLRCFSEAARSLNFRAAARSVGVTPAALGQRIRQLEDQLGTPLFHRTTRTVVLTEAGLAMVPHADSALRSAQDCVRAGRGELGPAPMEMVIGTRHELGLSWLVPILPVLRERHAGLMPHLYFGSGSDLVLRVRTREIDCAVTSTRITDPKLDTIRVHREDYVFVGQAEMIAAKPFRRADHAANHVLIDVSEELPLFHYWRDAPGGIDSMEFSRVWRVGTIAAIRALVIDGQGVAVLPAYYVAADLREKRLVKILPKVTPQSDQFRLVFRADDPRRAIYPALAETMQSEPLR